MNNYHIFYLDGSLVTMYEMYEVTKDISNSLLKSEKLNKFANTASSMIPIRKGKYTG